MAICGSCGKQIRDDAWTCGFCGAPVARQKATEGGGAYGEGDAAAYGAEGYNPYASAAAADPYGAPGGAGPSTAYGAATTSYGSAAEGMTPYGTPLPQTPAAKQTGGLSGTVKLVLAGAAVAVVAIILVWFLVIRQADVGGGQFVGDWQAVDKTSGSLTIAKSEGRFEITLASPQGSKAGPLKGDLQGDRLELKLEAANDDDTSKAIATIMNAYLSGALDDAHLWLVVREADGHLVLSISGKAAGSGDDVNAEAAEYAKSAGGV